MEKEASWSFVQIWNDSLLTYADRPYKRRDYMYASELGGPMIDRWLKMKGSTPTNPPNNRSLRKFQAGNIWEWIVGFVLLRSGILKKAQKSVRVELPGCVPVSGRLDYIGGGYMDWERADFEVKSLELPEYLLHATNQIIYRLKQIYGEGAELTEVIIENKSVSSYVFERNEKANAPSPMHVPQLFHYLYGDKKEEGKLVYICKDDCRIQEFPVFNPDEEAFAQYRNDIEEITNWYRGFERPPLEPEIIFEQGTNKFKKNWRVEYSVFLTMLYGYKDLDDFKERWDKTVAGWNGTFKRCVDGANMTALNKERIAEAKKVFPDWDDLVSTAKKAGIIDEGEEDI